MTVKIKELEKLIDGIANKYANECNRTTIGIDFEDLRQELWTRALEKGLDSNDISPDRAARSLWNLAVDLYRYQARRAHQPRFISTDDGDHSEDYLTSDSDALPPTLRRLVGSPMSPARVNDWSELYVEEFVQGLPQDEQLYVKAKLVEYSVISDSRFDNLQKFTETEIAISLGYRGTDDNRFKDLKRRVKSRLKTYISIYS